MCKIGVHEFSFGVENFELRGGVFMPFISRPCLDWGREKKINCQKSFNFFFYADPFLLCAQPTYMGIGTSPVNNGINVIIISYTIFHG